MHTLVDDHQSLAMVRSLHNFIVDGVVKYIDVNCYKYLILQVTRDVITEFFEDGVLYLELRSTPKTYELNSKCYPHNRTVWIKISCSSCLCHRFDKS